LRSWRFAGLTLANSTGLEKGAAWLSVHIPVYSSAEGLDRLDLFLLKSSQLPPAPVVSLPVLHSEDPGCHCTRCAEARASVIRAGFVGRPTSSRSLARVSLVERLEAQRGLSNSAYLAASSGTVSMKVTAGSSRVKFSLSDPIADALAPVRTGGGTRGVITELSEASRDRLADVAWSLTAEGHKPTLLLTVTSPANFEYIYHVDPDTGEVIEGGPLFKLHMQTFRKRLDRFLKKHGVYRWSALWFIEFQKRGAPHLHLMLFNCEISEKVRGWMRGWCGRAWSSIVGNPSKKEQKKHQAACSRVERVRVPHFGYAVKYATKTEQKEVPAEFSRVGRFWGVWNHKGQSPVVLDFDLDLCSNEDFEFLLSMVVPALETIREVAPRFSESKLEKVSSLRDRGKLPHRMGFTVYGSAASRAALGVLSEKH